VKIALDKEFASYFLKWRLVPDGEKIVARGALLLPVLQSGTPAMFRLATTPKAIEDANLMSWWRGDGAARVLLTDGKAQLLERATGDASLLQMAQGGRDDEATRILCQVVAKLHAPRSEQPPKLTSLMEWFAALHETANSHSELTACSKTAMRLLAEPRDVRVLHGDIHHGNVLDFAARGWLAIDPKGLFGERGFDYANIFCNPDIEWPTPAVAVRKDIFAQRLTTVSRLAGIETSRLLDWIVAWAGLSASWLIADGDNPFVDLEVAALAQSARTSH
jgi:streptomycin 6-kinase